MGEKLRERTERLAKVTKELTVSIGVSSYPADAEELNDLIKKADDLLYKAKREGKNKVYMTYVDPLKPDEIILTGGVQNKIIINRNAAAQLCIEPPKEAEAIYEAIKG